MINQAFLRANTLKNLTFPLEVCKVDTLVKPMPLFHWHEYWELTLVTRGHGVYEIEQNTISVQAGDLIVVNPNQRHRLSFSTEHPVYETVIHFEQRLLNAATLGFASTGIGGRIKNFPFEGGSRPYALPFHTICDACTRQIPYYEWVATGQLYILFALLLQSGALEPLSAKSQQRHEREMARLERILDYIRSEAANDLKMTQTAQKFYMNPTYFSEYFKIHMGVSFREYLMRLRIDMAIELMSKGAMSVAQIAQQTGYSASAGFNHAFKRITGQSPSDYRSKV